MPATPQMINFTKADSIRLHASGKLRGAPHSTDLRAVTEEGKLLTPKQIRARARRRAGRTSARARSMPVLTEQEFNALYKPVEEWDLEELARGRPRDVNGGWAGKKPAWITRDVHEKAMEQFQLAIRTGMSSSTVTALETIQYILENELEDAKGKPLVPASVKLQASTFLIEHVVGKPTQRVQQDISVKLQSILGAVMVNPNEALAPPSQGGMAAIEGMDLPAYNMGHMPGQTIPIGLADTIEGELVDDDSDLDERGE